MARRSKAREVVLQMLYQVDLNSDVPREAIRLMMAERLDEPELLEFAWGLFTGVLEFRTLLDEKIQTIAPHWKLSRMPATDRNTLRLGAFELIQTTTPHRVVINEALELARKFGNQQSAQFVNGVLDKLVPPEKRTGVAVGSGDEGGSESEEEGPLPWSEGETGEDAVMLGEETEAPSLPSADDAADADDEGFTRPGDGL
ncbi:MAG: transcription antitermination factor NusB [Planctomyces sp.]|nr:transcription antitermination factor NusB [Planctomyces sp.]